MRTEPTTPAQPLTDAQREVLAFIKGFIVWSGYPPTVREIAERFRWQVSGPTCHLKALEHKGYIRRVKGISRGIQVIAG